MGEDVAHGSATVIAYGRNVSARVQIANDFVETRQDHQEDPDLGQTG